MVRCMPHRDIASCVDFSSADYSVVASQLAYHHCDASSTDRLGGTVSDILVVGFSGHLPFQVCLHFFHEGAVFRPNKNANIRPSPYIHIAKSARPSRLRLEGSKQYTNKQTKKPNEAIFLKWNCPHIPEETQGEKAWDRGNGQPPTSHAEVLSAAIDSPVHISPPSTCYHLNLPEGHCVSTAHVAKTP